MLLEVLLHLQVVVNLLVPGPWSIAQSIAIADHLVELTGIGIGHLEYRISRGLHENRTISLTGVLGALQERFLGVR